MGQNNRNKSIRRFCEQCALNNLFYYPKCITIYHFLRKFKSENKKSTRAGTQSFVLRDIFSRVIMRQKKTTKYNFRGNSKRIYIQLVDVFFRPNFGINYFDVKLFRHGNFFLVAIDLTDVTFYVLFVYQINYFRDISRTIPVNFDPFPKSFLYSINIRARKFYKLFNKSRCKSRLFFFFLWWNSSISFSIPRNVAFST